MSDNHPSAEVLGKLLVALQTLDILPDVIPMAEFLQATLCEVPGVTSAFVCLDKKILPAGQAAVATLDLYCPQAADPSGAAPCVLKDRPDIQLVAIRTPRRAFGCLQLVVDSKAGLAAYKPFLVNIGHMVATILENREIDQSLARANAHLGELVDDLENRIKDRTRELEAAEKRYRTTLTTLPDAISTLRAVRGENGAIIDFEWTYANPAEAALHPQTNLVGVRLLNIHPEFRELGPFDAFCAVAATGEQSLMELEGAHGQLGARFAEYRTSRMDDGIVVAIRDVTHHHLAAQMLKESEERYRLVAENASDVVMLLTPSWRFEWVSGSVADVLGWEAPNLVGHPIEEFIHPDDLARFRLEVANAGPDSISSLEFQFRRSDHTYHWVAGRTRVKVDQDGTPIAVVGGLVDIADRKATEASEQARLDELEQFQRLTVGRELKMIELKKEIKYLKKNGPTTGSQPDQQ